MALFKIQNNKVKKLLAKELGREKSLQYLFEENLEEILNITFLASEYSTSFGGRIDTLGIDKTGAPVIIEYKKSQNNNVINQGLSYLCHKRMRHGRQAAQIEALLLAVSLNLWSGKSANF